MLVLSRREGESVCLDNNITVTIVKITGNKIRIGIKTEGEVSILRGELRQDKEATRFPDTDVPETEGISDSGIRQKKQRLAG